MNKRERTAFSALYDAISDTLYRLSCGDTIVGDSTEKHDSVIKMETALEVAEELHAYDMAKAIFVQASRQYSAYAERVELNDIEVENILSSVTYPDSLWSITRTALLDKVPELQQELK